MNIALMVNMGITGVFRLIFWTHCYALLLPCKLLHLLFQLPVDNVDLIKHLLFARTVGSELHPAAPRKVPGPPANKAEKQPPDSSLTSCIFADDPPPPKERAPEACAEGFCGSAHDGTDQKPPKFNAAITESRELQYDAGVLACKAYIMGAQDRSNPHAPGGLHLSARIRTFR